METNETKFDAMLTLSEIAPIIGVSYRTLLSYVYSGRLKARKIGGKWRVTETDFRAFLSDCESGETRKRRKKN